MGQGASKVVVHVKLDSPYYYAGDRVTGSVVLHVPQQIDVKSINVKVTGVEKCVWEERRQSGKVTHTESYHGKHVILKHKLPLLGLSTIAPGDYQWPITFELPPNVPGTFHYQNGTTRASIEYKVKADVDQEGFFKPDFKHTLRFEVLQRTKGHPGPTGPQAASIRQPISAWCCLNKGSLALTATTNADSYLPGQLISAGAQVDNQSTVQVSLVEFVLHQRLHLVAQTFFGDRHKTIDTARLISRQQALGGTPGLPGTTCHYAAALNLDPAFEATCLGKVVQSSYELVVTARTGCCLSEAKVKQPLLINDPQPVVPAGPPPPGALVAPPGWMPQVYPTVALHLPTPDCHSYGPGPMALGVPLAPAPAPAPATQPMLAPPPPPQQYGPGAPLAAPLLPQQQQYGQQYLGAPSPPPPPYELAVQPGMAMGQQYGQQYGQQSYGAPGAAPLAAAPTGDGWAAYQPPQQHGMHQQQYSQPQYGQQQYSAPLPGVGDGSYQAAPATPPGAVCYVGGQLQQQYGAKPGDAGGGGAMMMMVQPPAAPAAAAPLMGWGSGMVN